MKNISHNTVSPSLGSTEDVRESAVKFFDPILPAGQEWFTPKEVATLLGCSDQFVRECLETGRLLGHLLSNITIGERKRVRYQVHREGLALFLLETANYNPSDVLDRLSSALNKRPDKW